MITAITDTRQLPESFRLFDGTIEQACKLFPTATIYHYIGSSTRYGVWQIIAIA